MSFIQVKSKWKAKVKNIKINSLKADANVKEVAEMEVEATLPKKISRKKKTMPGEMVEDEASTDAEMAYTVEVHNQVMDTVTESIHHHFLT